MYTTHHHFFFLVLTPAATSVSEDIEIDKVSFSKKLVSNANLSQFTKLEKNLYLTVPKLWLYLQGKGKQTIFHSMPSCHKEGKKFLGLSHRFGSIVTMSSRCILSCHTHKSRTCSCVFVGLCDHTSLNASGVDDPLLVFCEEDNVDEEYSGIL